MVSPARAGKGGEKEGQEKKRHIYMTLFLAVQYDIVLDHLNFDLDGSNWSEVVHLNHLFQKLLSNPNMYPDITCPGEGVGGGECITLRFCQI